jgi:hypothetical protein
MKNVRPLAREKCDATGAGGRGQGAGEEWPRYATRRHCVALGLSGYWPHFAYEIKRPSCLMRVAPYTSTVALRVVKGTQCPGVELGHPVPGGYKYGNLDLQVGGVSDETVKYGYGF